MYDLVPATRKSPFRVLTGERNVLLNENRKRACPVHSVRGCTGCVIYIAVWCWDSPKVMYTLTRGGRRAPVGQTLFLKDVVQNELLQDIVQLILLPDIVQLLLSQDVVQHLSLQDVVQHLSLQDIV